MSGSEDSFEDVGLLCVPPGWTAGDVEEYNKDFKAMSAQDRSAEIGRQVQRQRDAGVTVIDINDEGAKEQFIKMMAAQLRQGGIVTGCVVVTEKKEEEQE
jgi:hypothetical protein